MLIIIQELLSSHITIYVITAIIIKPIFKKKLAQCKSYLPGLAYRRVGGHSLASVYIGPIIETCVG